MIRLTYDTPGITQDVVLGMDPGRTSIGATAVGETREVFCQAHVATRNQEIPGLRKKRKGHRNAGRRHRRQKTRRRAFKRGTVTQKPCREQKRIGKTLAVGVLERKLPGCKKPIRCIGIRNREAGCGPGAGSPYCPAPPPDARSRR